MRCLGLVLHEPSLRDIFVSNDVQLVGHGGSHLFFVEQCL
jgi:hypothetical protein